nr:PREDICTED: uncharacterized protein LOC105678255 isoform X2 [Linepithema humile]
MSFEERIQKKHPWVEKCFTKTVNFRVQCLEPSCKEILKYVNFTKYSEFKKHIFEAHLDCYHHEENEKDNMEWKYFRLTTKKDKACIICDICPKNFSQNENLSEHVKKHSKLERDLGRQNETWGWKYLRKSRDFSATCKLCKNDTKREFIVDISKMKQHILKEHEEKSHLIEERYKQTWEFQIENNYWLNKCYRKPVHFLTECKFCNEELAYVQTRSIQNHMKNKHEVIHDAEDTKMKARSVTWQYLRFTKPDSTDEVQCMRCDKTMPRDEAENHVEKYFTGGLEPGKYKNWTFKYARQNTDNVTCTICGENVTLTAKIYELKLHVSNVHEKIWDAIKQEDLLWSREITWNTHYIVYTWWKKCYINAENFRAQCKFCEHKIPYITHTQFLEHMKNKHSALHSLEEEKNTPDIFDEFQWNYIRKPHNIYTSRGTGKNTSNTFDTNDSTRPS